MSKHPIVGYVVLAKRQREDGSSDYQAVSAVWPGRNWVEAYRASLASEAASGTEYIIGEIRGSA